MNSNHVVKGLRLLLAVFLAGAMPSVGHASDSPRALFESANTAYYAGDYQTARADYSAIVETFKLEDAVVYHNLGNAHFRVGAYGAAILYYRRALNLEPAGEIRDGLRRNLETARRVLQNRYRSGGDGALVYSDPGGVVWQLTHLVDGDTLAIVSGVFWALFFGLLVLRRFKPSLEVLARRVAVGTAVALVLSGAMLAGRVVTDASFSVGVVVQPDAVLRDGPHASAQGRELPEGLEVRLVESVDGWLQIELVGGRRGWVAEAQIKQI